MDYLIKHRPAPGTGARLRKVLFRALLLSLPTLAVNLVFQGRREFGPELDTNRKYRQLTAKTIGKG